MNVALPDSPRSRVYRDLLLEIEVEHETDPLAAMAKFRAWAEKDFWFFTKYCLSFGLFKIDEPTHPRHGSLWIDEPFLFDRLREAQWVFEHKPSTALFYIFRWAFKSTAIVKGGCLWLLARNAQDTVTIFTHKADQVGESFGGDILAEIQGSEVLQAHWPQFRRLLEASNSRITVEREPGPKEPSISLYPIFGSAASAHTNWIFTDDAMNERIVESSVLLTDVGRQLSLLVPLRLGNTPIIYVGMPFGAKDPIYQRYKDGEFEYISFHPCYDHDGDPKLHSREFFQKQRKDMRDDYLFSCHYLLNPVQRGDRYFRDEWKRFYKGAPVRAAQGARIHAILDPAGGNDKSDFTVLRVVAHCADKKRRVLDLWRERIGLALTYDLIFGPRDPDRPEALWLPRDGVAKQWLKIDPDFTLWVEDFGNSVWYQSLAHEKRERMRAGGPDFNIRKLPNVGNRKKARRIRFLQAYYRDGEIEYPEGGFGHPSQDDKRDTMDQFFEDEYSMWVFDAANSEGMGVLHDDMLDTDAWPVQPELLTLMAFADETEASVGGLPPGWPFNRDTDAGNVTWSQASGRAY